MLRHGQAADSAAEGPALSAAEGSALLEARTSANSLVQKHTRAVDWCALDSGPGGAGLDTLQFVPASF